MFTRRNLVEMPADGPVTMGGGALVYGGFWARFAALLIDNAILTIVAMALIVAASLVDESLVALAFLAYFIGALLYWPLMEASARQATFGKQLLGLQVTDGAGQRLSFVRSLLRNIAKIISAIPLYIGFLLAAFTSRKQALHDILTNCMVVRSGPFHFLKVVGATVVAIIITTAGGYYYYSGEMEKAEKAAQKSKPAPKPMVQQAQAPGQAFPAGKPAPAAAEPAPVKPAAAPVAPEPAPVKPAAAPAAPEPAPKVVATAPVKEPVQPAKPAAAPASAPAKPAMAEIKPAPAKPAATPAAPAKPASPAPMKVAAAPAAKVKPAPKPEPVVVAAAPADEAPKEPRQAPAPRAAPPAVEVTRVPAAAAGPTLTYNDIMTAVMYRDQGAASQLLNLGWWPDRPDSNGVTPLMAAAMNGDAAMAELLLSRGANPLLRGPAGSTVDYANRGGNAAVVDLLRKAGVR